MGTAPFAATVHTPAGLVCSADHLASSAGVTMLSRGGSAVDAAVAANAVLAVADPHLCGMGGDLYALVHDGTGPPLALDAAGRAGRGADPDRLRGEGHVVMPFRGDIRSVTVPGCVDGWCALHERFGRLPLADVLAPAIGYAEDGYNASLLLAFVAPLVAEVPGVEDWATRPVRDGQRLHRPRTAEALRAIARQGREGFYGGAFGEGLLALGAGEYEADDLLPRARWVEPLGLRAWGHDLWTMPPSSQGYLILAGAGVLDPLPLPDPADASWAHLLVEAARLTGADRYAVLSDTAVGTDLVAPLRLDAVRNRLDPGNRVRAPGGPSAPGDTTVVTAVDVHRQGVTLIQSNASDFGAHLVEPSTGTFLHNRGIGFRLDPGHPAEYRPGRQPPHTLSPALVTTTAGELRAVVGTMGGDSQPQVVLQLLARSLAAGEAPGPVISAPRAVLARSAAGSGFDLWDGPDGLLVEDHAPRAWIEGLGARGHDVVVRNGFGAGFGHAHLIEVTDDGLRGAADPRTVIGSAAGL
ncbi:MAG TPA: gamma-glutamyltransferase [Acidimicrobiales bacterium]